MAVTSKASNQLMTKADVIELINNAISTISFSGQHTGWVQIGRLEESGEAGSKDYLQFYVGDNGTISFQAAVDGKTSNGITIGK